MIKEIYYIPEFNNYTIEYCCVIVYKSGAKETEIKLTKQAKKRLTINKPLPFPKIKKEIK